jgi:hypothetical protein
MNNENLYEIFITKIKKLEEEYIWHHYSSFQLDKDKEIKQIMNSININKNNNNINKELILKEKESILSKLHKLSLTNGGFISIENRKKVYKYILDTLCQKINYNVPELIYDFEGINSFDQIISNDCNRSVLYQIINKNENFKKEFDQNDKCVEYIINQLKIFTKKSLSNYIIFHYYQGYQEICLYFYIIFGMEEGIIYMNKFTKIFLEYICKEKSKINFELLLDVLNECCNKINKSTNEALNKITKTKPYYSLSWLLTYLTHDNKNFFNQMRVLDYLITCNISSVYFFSANIIVNEFNDLKKNFTLNEEEEFYFMEQILVHFQKLKLGEIEYEKIIEQTELINQYSSFNKIIEEIYKNCHNDTDKNFIKPLTKEIYHDISILPSNMKKLSKKEILIIISLLILIISIGYLNYKN